MAAGDGRIGLVSERLTFPDSDDAHRAEGLRAMKARATGLLVGAAVVFVLARIFHTGHRWVDYVLAAAEGAMVGGLADWFAVTALFRHPMGLPIPHTALIPTRKNQLGVAIGEFVEQNFLTGSVVLDKLRAAGMARRAATWAADDENAATVARHASAVLAGAAGVLRDEAVQGAIEHSMASWVRRIPLAPVAGRALKVATQDGRHEELLDAAFRGGVRFLEEHREDLRGRFGKESPWWVPDAIDDRVFNKLFDGLRDFLLEVGATPHHEFRQYLEQRIHVLADRLQNDPDLLKRGEDLKEQLLAHPAVRAWTMSLWTDFKNLLQRQAIDPSSQLRRRIAEEVAIIAVRIGDDDEMLGKIDGWIESAVLYLLDEHRHQAGDLIASTVARWDPQDASRRVELAVGRDLQFIRINGTVVGGLAGLVIYSVGQLIG
jgi:uncharacterized membrane-anchored protein YjiN (DUF445 family)